MINFDKKSFALALGAILAVFILASMMFKNNGKNSDGSINSVSGNSVSGLISADSEEKIKQPDGLMMEDEIIGAGSEAMKGKTIVVNYIGTLENGKKFDSSYDRNEPFSFVLDSGQVIRGWEEGVAGMKVGGKRKLTIPPELGYGNQDIGNGLIPPNSTLIFEVELLDVK